MARIVLTRPEPTAEGPPAQSARRPRVLIVDDDEDIRNLASMLLASEGFDVVGESINGMEAVQMSMDAQPDFVVLDFMMPEIDGEEASRFIRATCPAARIIGFSGAVHTKPTWCDHFVYKGELSRLAELLTTLSVA